MVYLHSHVHTEGTQTLYKHIGHYLLHSTPDVFVHAKNFRNCKICQICKRFKKYSRRTGRTGRTTMSCKGQLWQFLRYFTFTFTKAGRGLLLWQDSGRIGNNWQHFPQVQVTFLNKWREQFSQQMEVDFLVELGRNYCFHRNFEGGSFEAILEWIQEHRETRLRGHLTGLHKLNGLMHFISFNHIH